MYGEVVFCYTLGNSIIYHLDQSANSVSDGNRSHALWKKARNAIRIANIKHDFLNNLKVASYICPEKLRERLGVSSSYWVI